MMSVCFSWICHLPEICHTTRIPQKTKSILFAAILTFFSTYSVVPSFLRMLAPVILISRPTSDWPFTILTLSNANQAIPQLYCFPTFGLKTGYTVVNNPQNAVINHRFCFSSDTFSILWTFFIVYMFFHVKVLSRVINCISLPPSLC